jgi:hypothetical protein
MRGLLLASWHWPDFLQTLLLLHLLLLLPACAPDLVPA